MNTKDDSHMDVDGVGRCIANNDGKFLWDEADLIIPFFGFGAETWQVFVHLWHGSQLTPISYY